MLRGVRTRSMRTLLIAEYTASNARSVSVFTDQRRYSDRNRSVCLLAKTAVRSSIIRTSSFTTWEGVLCLNGLILHLNAPPINPSKHVSTSLRPPPLTAMKRGRFLATNREALRSPPAEEAMAMTVLSIPPRLFRNGGSLLQRLGPC